MADTFSPSPRSDDGVAASEEREGKFAKQLRDKVTDTRKVPLQERIEDVISQRKKGSTADSPELGDNSWSFAQWLDSLKFSGALAKTIADSMGIQNEDDALAVMKMLGNEGTVDGVTELLSKSDVLSKLAIALLQGAASLAQAKAASGEEMRSKFAQEGGTFELAYGGLDTFYGGLERLVGAPNPNLISAMRRDHCFSTDSKTEFVTSNYGIKTTSKKEFGFVFNPEGGPDQEDMTEDELFSHAGKLEAELEDEGGSQQESADSEPHITYASFKAACENGDLDIMTDDKRAKAAAFDWPAEADAKLPGPRSEFARKPFPVEDFTRKLQYIGKLLKAAKESPLQLAEFLGGRLYTGPMFVKYNAVLRLFTGNAYMAKCYVDYCADNKYVTTLHVINSALLKMSKVLPATTVFRGVAGGLLPSNFWDANEHNVRGGVEYGFMSTTTNQEVAKQYVSGSSVGTVFEMKLGMVDRGADLSWLSQYPHEAEICFGPLTGIEVSSTRVEKTMLIVDVRLNVNLASSTIEQVIAKRRKVVADMCDNLEIELKAITKEFPFVGMEKVLCEECFDDWSEIYGSSYMKAVRAKFDAILIQPPELFNNDDELLAQIAEAVDVKAWLTSCRFLTKTFFRDAQAKSSEMFFQRGLTTIGADGEPINLKPSMIAMIVARAQDADHEIREGVAGVLGCHQLWTREHASTLVHLSMDPKLNVRRAAEGSMSDMGVDVVEYASDIAAHLTDKSHEARLTAACALDSMQDKKSEYALEISKALQGLLSDDNPDVTNYTLSNFEKAGQAGANAARALFSNTDAIRLNAMNAFATVSKDTGAIAHMLGDNSDQVRKACDELLKTRLYLHGAAAVSARFVVSPGQKYAEKALNRFAKDVNDESDSKGWKNHLIPYIETLPADSGLNDRLKSAARMCSVASVDPKEFVNAIARSLTDRAAPEGAATTLGHIYDCMHKAIEDESCPDAHQWIASLQSAKCEHLLLSITELLKSEYWDREQNEVYKKGRGVERPAWMTEKVEEELRQGEISRTRRPAVAALASIIGPGHGNSLYDWGEQDRECSSSVATGLSQISCVTRDDHETACAFIGALARMGGLGACHAATVLSFLAEGDYSVFEAIVDAFRGWGALPSDVIAKVVAFLSNESTGARKRALELVAALAEQSSTRDAVLEYAPNIATLLKDPDSDVYQQSATTLGKLGEVAAPWAPGVAALFIVGLLDVDDEDEEGEEDEEHAAACGALDNIVKHGKCDATTLSTLVAESDDDYLKTAATALDKIGATASDLSSAMECFLTHEWQRVRKAAAKAIQCMGMLGEVAEKVEEVLAEEEEGEEE